MLPSAEVCSVGSDGRQPSNASATCELDLITDSANCHEPNASQSAHRSHATASTSSCSTAPVKYFHSTALSRSANERGSVRRVSDLSFFSRKFEHWQCSARWPAFVPVPARTEVNPWYPIGPRR